MPKYRFTDTDKEELNDTPIRDVMDSLGVPISRRQTGDLIDYKCPFHNASHYGAAKIYLSTNSCHCFSCNESWDTIAFVQKNLNLSFKDTLIWLANMIGTISKYEVDSNERPKKSQYQLRLLTSKEKEDLGLDGKQQTFRGNPELTHPITGWSSTKPEGMSVYDYDSEGYLILGNDKRSLSTLMRDDPIGYRTLIISKVAEAFEDIEEERSIWKNDSFLLQAVDARYDRVMKVAKDFGYFRVKACLLST